MKIHNNIIYSHPSFKGYNQQPNALEFINNHRLTDSFISYAQIDTQSKEDVETSPSTKKQLVLAKKLESELKQLGLKEVILDKEGAVMAILPSNISDEETTVGLFAHMDTSPDASGENVKPLIHLDYEEGDIRLKNDVVIEADDLNPVKGQDVITSDGNTLLGADDKAGIAEIVEAMHVFKEHPELKHPRIKVVFTPDEEVGSYIDKFNTKKSGITTGYIVDGMSPDEINKDTFNAITTKVKIKGVNTHLGQAYKKLVNSIKLANELIDQLPKNESPEETKDTDGFYHIESISGDSINTELTFWLRDYDLKKAQQRAEFLEKIAKKLEEKYPGVNVDVKSTLIYMNPGEGLDSNPEYFEITKEGMKRTGLNPKISKIRGGTDGSSLFKQGLATINIGAGMWNYHTVKEFTSIQAMQKTAANIVNILGVWAEKLSNPSE